jgi:hypothetical protein
MPVMGGRTHHCWYKGCNYKPSGKGGAGYCPKHQWACFDTAAHGKGGKIWYMSNGQSCGGCSKEAPSKK